MFRYMDQSVICSPRYQRWVLELARKNGIKPSTLYNVLRNNSKLERTGIDTFLKIAHGLDMTADELYEYCFVELPHD